MFATRLVPVVVLKNLAHAEPLAEALLAGGLDTIELTLRTDCALDAIKLLSEKYPQIKLGAGTVLDAGIVPQLVDLGCQYAVSPGLNPKVIEATQKADLPIFAGVANPTDIETARELGLQTLKFFPAEPLGGASMLKALIGPYGHTGIKFIPTGGITLEKAPSYAALPEVAAIGGSWFVDAKLMAEGNWAQITKRTEEAIKAIAESSH
ncbi:bifunctional 4-hydroxy-2-oxoglutarate aldolase/2-dehydro-3-deoxy-phosphogluconate aldolase [Roseibacillus persicicus]|uniref:bifunctional 4-hydroxy-2-oxoglutarate aldolase/2-dehydro-3-deoxy-phosphogluconate aldolase n=1 Tax=Roseibacillus persicicus TaxID=454148 RepID=UPI00398BB3B6